jgi:hypothetical protein
VTKLDKGPVDPLLINVSSDEAETAIEEPRIEAESAEAEIAAEQFAEEVALQSAEAEPAAQERVH